MQTPRESKEVTCPRCHKVFPVECDGPNYCPNCHAEVIVRLSGSKDVEIPPVRQPDEVSCGWATMLWLLRSFGKIGTGAAAAAELRKEILTDTLLVQGTLPHSMYSALSKRGLTIKNPFRFESPMEYVDYLEDTFREGGRAILLAWRLDGFMHWMGVDKKNGEIRVMDPARGDYFPFETALQNWKTAKYGVRFVVVGIVKK